jgi:hypothetical protein
MLSNHRVEALPPVAKNRANCDADHGQALLSGVNNTSFPDLRSHIRSAARGSWEVPMAEISAITVASVAVSSYIKRRRVALWLAIAGGLSFWLPDIAVHISAGTTFSSRHVAIISILMPGAFLLTYVCACRLLMKSNVKWICAPMLLGVWLTGGVFMMLAGIASGSDFIGGTGAWRVLVIVLSVIPIVTYILAAYDGSLFALLAVTLGALLFWGLRTSWTLLDPGSLQHRVAGEKSDSEREKAA